MNTIMNQVTCSLCIMRIDELKWKEHLVSTNHIQLCKDNKDKIAVKFFQMIFNACPKKSKIFNLKNEKSHDFWQLHFSTKLPKEKFNILCSDPIDNSEIEASLSSDFQNFIQNVTPDIGETHFNLMDKIMFCKICSIQINKSLLYDHINSKEHKDIEKYFIMKCMTYCEYCDKEIKNDEWREHVISEKHLELEEKRYCEICNMKYDIHYNSLSYYYNKTSEINHRGSGHINSNIHMENEKRLGFYNIE